MREMGFFWGRGDGDGYQEGRRWGKDGRTGQLQYMCDESSGEKGS